MEQISNAAALAAQKPSGTSTLSVSHSSPQYRDWIKTQLAMVASAQQATLSREDYRLYSTAMAEFEQRDVVEAIRMLCLRERHEGETAFPALPTALRVIRTVTSDRRRREATKRTKECARCKGTGMEI